MFSPEIRVACSDSATNHNFLAATDFALHRQTRDNRYEHFFLFSRLTNTWIKYTYKYELKYFNKTKHTNVNLFHFDRKEAPRLANEQEDGSFQNRLAADGVPPMNVTESRYQEVHPGAGYTDDEVEFMLAMERYKRIAQRPFPTWHEVLSVIRELGYRKPEKWKPRVMRPHSE